MSCLLVRTSSERLPGCLLACLPADPRLVPGGGAVEMAVSRGLAERANSGAVEGVEQVRPRLVWQAGRGGGLNL